MIMSDQKMNLKRNDSFLLLIDNRKVVNVVGILIIKKNKITIPKANFEP